MADDITADDQEAKASEDQEGEEIEKEESGKGEQEGGKESEEGKEIKEPEVEPEIEEKDVPVRKDVQEHIIARQKRTIEKLRSKEEEKEEEEDYGDGDNTDIQGIVAKELEKRLKPLVDTLSVEAEERELKSLVGTNPEAKKYEKRIRTYMQHEAYKGVPAEVIFHHLAFNEAAGVKEKKKEAADMEANQSRNAGTPRIKTVKTSVIPTIEEMDAMSESELEALKDDVLQGKYMKAA